MTRKTQKEIAREYLLANPSSTAREIAAGTGIKRDSLTSVLYLLTGEGMVRASGETVGRYGTARKYEAVQGVVHCASEAEEGSCEDVIERTAALGGGSFGLMAAQLGVRP